MRLGCPLGRPGLSSQCSTVWLELEDVHEGDPACARFPDGAHVQDHGVAVNEGAFVFVVCVGKLLEQKPQKRLPALGAVGELGWSGAFS